MPAGRAQECVFAFEGLGSCPSEHALLKGATFNTVTAALQCGGDVHVLIAGANAADAAQQAAQIAGVAKVLRADAPQLAEQLAENVGAQVLAIAKDYTHILFPATAHGKNVAPRVAAKLDVAQISDITKMVNADTFERPIYAGNAIATVQSADRSRSSPCARPASTRQPRAAAMRRSK
jgi:electron transfer flavoprotein alpha subunit